MKPVKPETVRTLIASLCWLPLLVIPVSGILYMLAEQGFYNLYERGQLIAQWTVRLLPGLIFLALAARLYIPFYLEKQPRLTGHAYWLYAAVLSYLTVRVLWWWPDGMNLGVMLLCLSLCLGVLIHVFFFTSPRPGLLVLAFIPAVLALITPYPETLLFGCLLPAVPVLAFWIKRVAVERAAFRRGGKEPVALWRRKAFAATVAGYLLVCALAMGRRQGEVRRLTREINALARAITEPHLSDTETFGLMLQELGRVSPLFVTNVTLRYTGPAADQNLEASRRLRWEYWYTNTFSDIRIQGLELPNLLGAHDRFLLYTPLDKQHEFHAFMEKYDRPPGEWEPGEVAMLIGVHRDWIAKWENDVYADKYPGGVENPTYMDTRAIAVSNIAQQISALEALAPNVDENSE